MAFLPVVNNSTGNLQIGEASKTLTMVGNTPFLSTAKWQTYTQTGTFSAYTHYNATPYNFLSTNIPFLVVGSLDLTSSPWFIRYAFVYTNLQQNGESRVLVRLAGFSHTQGLTYIQLGKQTSYYGDGVSTAKVGFWHDPTFTASGSLTHDFYRLGT